MPEDPILEEIWEVRRQLVEQAGGDVHAFFELIRAMEREREREESLNPPDTSAAE